MNTRISRRAIAIGLVAGGASSGQDRTATKPQPAQPPAEAAKTPERISALRKFEIGIEVEPAFRFKA